MLTRENLTEWEVLTLHNVSVHIVAHGYNIERENEHVTTIAFFVRKDGNVNYTVAEFIVENLLGWYEIKAEADLRKKMKEERKGEKDEREDTSDL